MTKRRPNLLPLLTSFELHSYVWPLLIIQWRAKFQGVKK